MKPSARIQASIEILEKIGTGKIPMDATIGDYMRFRRYIGSKDRAEIVERVYGAERARARISWHLAETGRDDTPRARIIAWLALGEEIDEKRFDDLFDGGKYAPEHLTGDERGFIQALAARTLNPPDMPVAARTECPALYETSLREYFGENFEAEMEAMIRSATLDLRVNTFLLAREQAQASLAKDGVETLPTPYSPWGLRAQGKAYLAKTKAFTKGLVEIQDEGSQMIAFVCGALPGMQVLDYCAGGGGKTLALASAMQRKGRIVAMDTDEKRLDKGRQRFKRAQLSDIIEVRPLSDEKHKKWLRRQKEKFDVVLLDVPCSGTGTWRRNPDLRWRQYGPSLEELLTVQADILERASPCVKPGGKLVYATCSLLPEENERQIEAFVAKHPEFEIVPVDASLGNPFLRLTPHRHNTDGFFAAVLQRI